MEENAMILRAGSKELNSPQSCVAVLALALALVALVILLPIDLSRTEIHSDLTTVSGQHLIESTVLITSQIDQRPTCGPTARCTPVILSEVGAWRYISPNPTHSDPPNPHLAGIWRPGPSLPVPIGHI